MTQYYASPTGAGSGLGAGDPFLIANFWTINGGLGPNPGDTLNLLGTNPVGDGLYTGTNSMIQPTGGISGDPGNPITIRAVNDGGVLIDGQSTVQRPVHLSFLSGGNDYYVIEGINARNGVNFTVRSSGTGNVFRRCIAWGVTEGSDGQQVWQSDGANGLVEDCASFGGRYAMGSNQMGISVGGATMTYRRCFTLFTTVGITSPKASYVYWYNSDPILFENCIGTWDSSTTNNPQGIFYAASAVDGFVHGAITVLNGCLAYLKASQAAPTFLSGISAQANRRITFNDCVAYMDPAHATANLTPFDLRVHNPPDGAPYNMTLSNSTGIGANASTLHGDWAQTNVETATSVAGAYPGGANTLYVNDGTRGATICKRYEDGVLTDEGLFPWPMNDRIMAACALAGLTVIDVTADIESIFGTIPDECRNDVVVPPETPSGGLGDNTFVFF